MCGCSAKGWALALHLGVGIPRTVHKRQEHLGQAKKWWKKSCWCCMIPVCSATNSASFFICILLSLWIHMISLKCKTTHSFLWAGVSFCPGFFFSKQQAQLGSWLMSRTKQSFSYQSVLLPLKFIAKFIPLSLAVKWYSIGAMNQSSEQRKRTNHKRKVLPRIDCSETIPHALGMGRCMPAVSGRVTLLTSGCESWGAVPAPLE